MTKKYKLNEVFEETADYSFADEIKNIQYDIMLEALRREM
jgi:hypothetical protein